MAIRLKQPSPDDCPTLTTLVFASKASHGYSADFMEACRDEIRVTPASLVRGPAIAAWSEDQDAIVGFAQVSEISPTLCELEALFVCPNRQRRGVGLLLLDWATNSAANAGARALMISADPGAEQFYLKAGAKRSGSTPSGSITGRLLPRLRIDLAIAPALRGNT